MFPYRVLSLRQKTRTPDEHSYKVNIEEMDSRSSSNPLWKAWYKVGVPRSAGVTNLSGE